MTDAHRLDDNRAYVKHVQVLVGLADRRAHEIQEADAAATAEFRRAQLEERATRDRLRAADERLARLERQLALLAHRAGVIEATAQEVRLEDARALDTLVRGLSTDIESARSAWEWVERAKAAEAARSTGVSAPTGPPVQAGRSEDQAATVPPSSAKRNRTAQVALAGATLLVLLVVVLLVVGGT